MHTNKVVKWISHFESIFKARVCSEYRVMLQIRKRNVYQQVSEFERGRIIVYQKCGLSFFEINCLTGWHPSTVMRIWNQWVAEGHTEWYAGSQSPPMTNAWEDRHIVRSALQNHITTSSTISQEMGMFAACPVSARTVRQYLQQCSLSARRSLLWLPLTMLERESDSSAPNNKAAYRNGTVPSFQTSPNFVCSILIAI